MSGEIITRVLNPDYDNLEYAAELLRNGEIVGIPTETVYGLAGNALCEAAVSKIFEAKGRPQDNPLIIHIADFDMLGYVTSDVPEIAFALAKEFFPGPLTMILPKSPVVPSATNCGLDTVAVRMPDNEIALKLIKLCGFPLAAPSANISGRPSPTSAEHVFSDMKGKIPLILNGGECKYGLESTVIAFIGNKIKILRPGAVTYDMLCEYAETELDASVLTQFNDNETPISPGIKHVHYSPRADVMLIKANSDDKFNEFLKKADEQAEEKTIAIVFNEFNPPPSDYLVMGDSAEEQSKSVFSLLREADRLGADKIYVRAPEPTGLGLAVYNRLLRAAGFNLIDAEISEYSDST